MLTKRESILSTIMIVMQVAITIVIFYSIEIVIPIDGIHIYRKLFYLFQIIPIWSLLFIKFRLGVLYRFDKFSNTIRGYFATLFIAGIILISELFIFRILKVDSVYTVKYIFLFLLTDLIVLISFKYFIYNWMRLLRRMGRNRRNVVIVADKETIPFIDQFIKSKDWGYYLLAIATSNNQVHNKYFPFKIINNQNELHDFITEKPIDDIFYCLSVNNKNFNIDLLSKNADEIGVNVHIIQEGIIENIKLKKSNHELKFKTHSKESQHYLGFKFKNIFDLFFSTFILVFFSPFIALIAILIKLEDGGPVLFKQQRIGLNGRRFYCLKFRSMIVNAEDKLEDLKSKNESDGPTFKIENDPRITKVGKFLRKTSLDEFPQFYNVMKGDMSIVGPRPPLLSEVKQYDRSQLRRLSMKPGITCIWQVSGRNSLSFEKWMELDLKYIDNWSPWLDIKLIFKTIGVIFKANGM